MSETALFISDQNFLNRDRSGGVQICTREYLDYIRLAGLSVKEYPVKPVIGIFNRIKIRLGLDTYDHYSLAPYLEDLVETIRTAEVSIVFFNQINLSPWAEELRRYIGLKVKFVGLSHGNESADYLNEITRQGGAKRYQEWKLGKLLVSEHRFFTAALDGIVVLTTQELAVNQWIGSQQQLYLPRLLKPEFMDLSPLPCVAGFVGTLDHLPNKFGLIFLADELLKLHFKGTLSVVGGPEQEGEKLALRYPFILYKGQLDDERLAQEIMSWSVYLNPVFWYARGASTKLAQAISLGLPCLTTLAGRRGYELIDESIVVQDNRPESFARALVVALCDESRLENLKDSSRKNAMAFDRKRHAEAFRDFLQKITPVK
ncbi:glycosyltransferase [Mucilaginibacter sp.]|uniref:glycosyltransferase n=1 Tax=Mucilaginibacter sp. TaxID=1882438 RepID=UPI0035BBDFE0